MAISYRYIPNGGWGTGGAVGAATHDIPGKQTSVPTVNVAGAKTQPEDAALQASVLWQSVKLIVEAVGQMPMQLHGLSADGAIEIIKRDPVVDVLALSPNGFQTPAEFKETMTLNLVLRGNAFIYKDMTASGTLRGLIPLSSAQMTVQVLSDGSVVYPYFYDGGVEVYAADSIIHVKSFGNNHVGMSPLDYSRGAVTSLLSIEGNLRASASSNGMPVGIITYDKAIKEDQREEVRKSLKIQLKENDGMLILERGMQFTKTQLTSHDLELAKHKLNTNDDIARFFNIQPAWLVGGMAASKATADLSSTMALFNKVTLSPILRKIEESFLKSLFSLSESRKFKIVFDDEALLRGDNKAYVGLVNSQISSGLITPNQGRTKMGLPRSDAPGMDEHYAQVNMAPLSMLGTIQANKANTGLLEAQQTLAQDQTQV